VYIREPALPVSSVLHTFSLKKVTAANQTFIEWSTDFSNDAGAEVILDSKFKKLDVSTMHTYLQSERL
jgi:hypothetical protein